MRTLSRGIAPLALAVVAGVLAGCAATPAEPTPRERLLELIDPFVQEYRAGDPELSEEEVHLLALFDGLDILDLPEAVDFGLVERDELIRAVGFRCAYPHHPRGVDNETSMQWAIVQLGFTGFAPEDLVTACLAAGASEETIRGFDIFTPEALAAAGIAAPTPTGPTWWNTAMTAAEGQVMCNAIRAHLGYPNKIGSTGLQSNSAGKFFQCSSGVNAGGRYLEINVQFEPPSFDENTREYAYCSAGEPHGRKFEAEPGLLDSRGGWFTADSTYSFCIGNTTVSIWERGKVIRSVIDDLWPYFGSPESAELFAGFVAQFEVAE